MTNPLLYGLALVALWCGSPKPARDLGLFEATRGKADVQHCREAAAKCLELKDERAQFLCFTLIRYE